MPRSPQPIKSFPDPAFEGKAGRSDESSDGEIPSSQTTGYSGGKPAITVYDPWADDPVGSFTATEVQRMMDSDYELPEQGSPPDTISDWSSDVPDLKSDPSQSEPPQDLSLRLNLIDVCSLAFIGSGLVFVPVLCAIATDDNPENPKFPLKSMCESVNDRQGASCLKFDQ